MIAKNRIAILCASFALSILATGCGAGSSSAPTAIAATGLRGLVHGGQQPVTGSHVYLFAMGGTGYGSASQSLVTLGASGVTTDTSGNGYVTTDSTGSFTMNNFTCPSSTTQVYYLAVGGNPGLTGTGTISNSAIRMISAVGQCSLQTSSTFVDINEITTAASIVALQQFMVDTTHVGTSSGNAQGLTIAGNLVTADLVNATTGNALATTVSGTGTVPQAELYSFGNMLAGCVNTSDPSQTGCTSLFSAAAPSGTTLPTDVAGAMLLIAKNPAANVNARYLLTTAQSPFPNGLTAQPNDWSVSVVFKGGGLLVPGAVVIDASGDAWTASCPTCGGVSAPDAIVGFGPYGAVLSGAAGYTSGIHKPGALAFDGLGNLWSVNAASSPTAAQIVKQTAGTADFAFSDSTISGPIAIAIDSSNNAWVTNQTTSSVVQVLSGGTRTLAPVTSTGFSTPTGIGIDDSGNFFAAGTGSSTVLKFASAGSVTSTAGGYTEADLSQPINISIDSAGHVYTINNKSSLISVINGSTGASISNGGFAVGISNANDLAVDGKGQVWFANCSSSCGTSGADTIRYFTVSGTTVTNYSPISPASLSRPSDLAIDGSGNLWVSEAGSASLTEVIGLGTPVTTPLAVAASSSKLGVAP